MNAQQFTPSELIYLFLDGEHSQVERTVLFNALVNNDDLQSEFEDALKIRAAAVQEAHSLVPPAAVTQSLMSRAGFAVAGAAASAPTAASWLAQWFSSWGATVLTYVVPALTALGGFALGYSSQNSNANSASVVASAPSQQIQVSDKNTDALNANLALLEAENARLRTNLDASRSAQNTLARENSVQRREINGLQSQIEEMAVVNTGTLADSPSSPPQQSEAYTETSSQPGQTALLRAEFNPQVVKIESVPMKVYLPVMPEEERETKYAVSLRGSSLLSITQQSLVSNQNDYPLRNLSIGMHWAASPHWSLLAEGGQEQFPLFVAGSEGLFLRQSILWAAVGGRYTMDQVSWMGNLQPMAQLSAGVTKSGPMLRGTLGFSWQLSDNWDVNAGFEGMSLIYKYNGKFENPMKLGFTYGVAIKF